MARSDLNAPGAPNAPFMKAIGETQEGNRLHALGRSLLQARELRLFILIIVATLLIHARTGTFFTSMNINAIGIGLATDAIIAVGMTVVLVGGGFDLSVGSMLAFGGMVGALLLNKDWPIVPSIFMTLMVGVGMAFLTGFWWLW